MENNIKCLTKACDELNIKYVVLHPSKNLLRISINGKERYVSYKRLPINDAADTNVAQDKDFSYHILRDSINIPKTCAYLGPNANERYKGYLEFFNNSEIVKDILEKFSLPVIVKRNSGSLGKNVFLCKSREEIESSIEMIFDKNSRNYDYVALAQEYVKPSKEYRVITLDGELIFMYEKNVDRASFVGNLSPLHYENSKAILITDSNTISKMQKFVRPVFESTKIRYTGIDVIEDADGELWLIEINSNPGFDHYIRDCGEKEVIELYKKILLSI